jgi:hypothetical protein
MLSPIKKKRKERTAVCTAAGRRTQHVKVKMPGGAAAAPPATVGSMQRSSCAIAQLAAGSIVLTQLLFCELW